MATDPMIPDSDADLYSAFQAHSALVSTNSSPNSQAQGNTPGTASDADKNSTPETSNDGRSRESTVPAACLACRSKHLKCDGQTPCARCISTQSECVYVASRRGYKGPRRGTSQNPNKRHATSPPDVSPGSSDCPMLLGARTAATNVPSTIGGYFTVPNVNPHDPAGTQFGPSQKPSNVDLYKSYCAVNGVDPSCGSVGDALSRATAQPPPLTLEEKCLESFYQHFHAAHPFVLPKPFLLQVSKEPPARPLLLAIRWTGSIFLDISAATRERLFNEAYELTHHQHRVKDGFLIQALMLLIVGLDGSCQQEKARAILKDVEAMAIELGLHTRDFAITHGRGIPVLEESWRRTWWDLFIIDGMIAGVHRATNFLLYDVQAGAALPCEEEQYLAAVSHDS
ncbi:hypothetical protein E4U43_005163 [Claviceps pusilla]|uniref:Zn(2)-C6 fungal-type domain-containing protein n=1 Tax=Claviceps pusilla TaxID=123648 RepID=A0A9P7SVN1_9HYPO|nr:hypothetical protein E4U43_005163 [Claviceps pusilla]